METIRDIICDWPPKREDEGGRGAPRRAEGEETAEAEEEAGAGDEEDVGVRARRRCHQAF